MPTPRYHARFAATPADVDAAQRLRHLAFIAATGAAENAARATGRDADAFDGACRHVLVEEIATGRLVATFRLLPLAHGGEIGQSYAARTYDLGALAAWPGPMLEMGRFCLRPGCNDPDILRLAWAQVARLVDEAGVGLLFGCSSFRGTDAGAYADAFAELARRHLAPRRWRPRAKAANVFRFARLLRKREPDARRAWLTMPPLLRSYLAMGGWVSDHAVVDRDMDTLHVFTGLEVRRIPPARARLMRALAV